MMGFVFAVCGNRLSKHLKKEAMMKFALHSPAFQNGGLIPDKYVEDSIISPPLEWDNAPEGTACFFLFMIDQDIPRLYRDNLRRGFVHWIISVSGDVHALAEGASPGRLPAGSREYKTDFVNFSMPGYGNHYGGPWPPDASHRYTFIMFALKAAPDLSPNADYTEIAGAVLFNAIDAASLIGVYGPAGKPLPG